MTHFACARLLRSTDKRVVRATQLTRQNKSQNPLALRDDIDTDSMLDLYTYARCAVLRAKVGNACPHRPRQCAIS